MKPNSSIFVLSRRTVLLIFGYVLQPVGEIARKLSAYKRSRFHTNTKVFLHTDASQAIGKIPVDVQKLGVDFLTITGHKVRNLTCPSGIHQHSPYIAHKYILLTGTIHRCVGNTIKTTFLTESKKLPSLQPKH